ncbi:MAG: hypothetical protein JNL74_18745 [Fibrobacteres bacterium]|nr:hypothetical protein [Fibrobacterota bacterium]
MKNAVVQEYDVSLDNKKRCVIRGIPTISRYHVQVWKTGKIVMEPRILASVEDLSERAQNRLLESIKNFKAGKVGGTFNPKEFPDI